VDKIYGIIYKATNKVNGKVYIGQTAQSLDKRILQHIKDALNNRDNSYFHKAIRKYGKESFIWEIIKECNSLEELNRTEIKMIEKYGSFENGYNLTSGGEKIAGWKHSEKTKQKMREFRKGKSHSKETKIKIGNGNRDKKVSEETRKKLGGVRRGKKHSEEAKKKISKAIAGEKHPLYGIYGKDNPNFGKHHSEETKKKMSLARKGKYIGKNSPWYGKKHSVETRKKMSDSKKGKKCYSYGRLGSGSLTAKRYVVITPEGKEILVHGIANFCRNYKKEKLNYTHLIEVARGKYKQHKGYKCRYL